MMTALAESEPGAVLRFRGRRGAASPEPAMESSPTDIALLERIGRQDREAFRLFYERYAAKILAYVRALARGREVSEDVVQEVFLAVWRKAGSYRRERGDVPGWLYTITRNKAVDLWRKRPVGSEETGADASHLVAVDHAGENRLLAVSLQKVLATLKPEQRQALELAYFGGLTYEETAARLSLPVGTLKSRIRTGLALLRERLTEGRS
jgi:RNA polymerase sigma-70 factor (ECF subfamily)